MDCKISNLSKLNENKYLKVYGTSKVKILSIVDEKKCLKAHTGTDEVYFLDIVDDRKCPWTHTGTDKV